LGSLLDKAKKYRRESAIAACVVIADAPPLEAVDSTPRLKPMDGLPRRQASEKKLAGRCQREWYSATLVPELNTRNTR
jgi:hypothetical protein